MCDEMYLDLICLFLSNNAQMMRYLITACSPCRIWMCSLFDSTISTECMIDGSIVAFFQGIPSSPVQETNPPVQAPASVPTDAPASLAEGEACNSFSAKNTHRQHWGLTAEESTTSSVIYYGG